MLNKVNTEKKRPKINVNLSMPQIYKLMETYLGIIHNLSREKDISEDNLNRLKQVNEILLSLVDFTKKFVRHDLLLLLHKPKNFKQKRKRTVNIILSRISYIISICTAIKWQSIVNAQKLQQAEEANASKQDVTDQDVTSESQAQSTEQPDSEQSDTNSEVHAEHETIKHGQEEDLNQNNNQDNQNNDSDNKN